MTRFPQPKYFFLGTLLGFVLCCLAGYFVSKTARFHHFSRFYGAISPSMQYFPTANELLATAKHELDPNKIIVLVGGSSIFRGTGQNQEELWSKELQKLLGDKYQVLNYGIDGGTLSSFGATGFRILKEHFPKIIFTASCTPGGAGGAEGVDVYKYLYWDAFYKKLYHPDESEQQVIQTFRNNEMMTGKDAEIHILSFLDSLLYFRNLWNWVEYRFVFTTWSDLAATSPFRPRKKYLDEDMDFKALQQAVKGDPNRTKAEIDLYGRIAESLSDFSGATPKINQARLEGARQDYNQIFSPAYRSNILCVVLSENPARITALPKKTQIAHSIVLKETRKMLEALGYNAIDIGENYKEDDFFDGGHLFVTGGKKMAADVAKKIKIIAKQNKYL